MAFCTKCGRQLQDGEVCNCQSATATPVAPVTPAAPTPAISSAQPSAAAGFFKDIVSLIVGLIKTPADTAVSSTQKASFPVSGIIILCVSVITALFTLFGQLVAYADSIFKPKYGIDFLENLLVVIVAAVVAGALYMLLANVLGGAKLNYNHGLHIAAMAILFVGIVAPVTFLIGIIPASFFSHLAGWIKIFASTLGSVYVITAINAAIVKKNMLPYIVACVAVVNSFISYIFGLMF